MTSRRPPVLAQTLLEWVDPANAPLHGDLLEEFAAGRSRLWYWQQVFGAAAAAMVRPVRAHGLAGLEPAMLGLIMLFMLGFYVVFVVNVTDWLLRVQGMHVLSRVPAWLAHWPLAAPLLSLLAGLIVGRMVCAGGDHRVARVIGFGAATMVCAIAGLKAAEELSVPVLLLPQFYQQVGTTAAFIAGLLGGVGSSLMLTPRTAPLELATGPAPVSP
ncbi:MAG: hypothetical protein Q8N52_03005 [Acidobacteriota bacterium]|nr:hypothetical protein [Acidobacteriota bacterium]